MLVGVSRSCWATSKELLDFYSVPSTVRLCWWWQITRTHLSAQWSNLSAFSYLMARSFTIHSIKSIANVSSTRRAHISSSITFPPAASGFFAPDSISIIICQTRQSNTNKCSRRWISRIAFDYCYRTMTVQNRPHSIVVRPLWLAISSQLTPSTATFRGTVVTH